MALLEIVALDASYGEIEVLHGIDLQVESGEIACLIGANGAGKSTLLRALSGLLPQTRGSVKFDGREILSMASHSIPALGIAHVPEGRHAFANLSVMENLRIGHFANAGRSERGAQLERVLSLFPLLAERGRQLAGTLSGGEQQMLVMGRAMMSAPRLLLLDEPSLGLSPLMADRVFGLIAELNRQGTTVLLVEQNAFRALRVATRGYVLESGKIMRSGLAAALSSDPEVQRLYLGG